MASRLLSVDEVAETPVVVASSVLANDLAQVSAAVAPDGTATLAWDERHAAGTPIAARQLTIDGTFGPVRTIAQSPATLRNVYPLLKPLRDGSLLAVWLEVAVADGSARYLSRVLAPDATPAGEELVVPISPQPDGYYDPRRLDLSIGAGGDGIAAAIPIDDDDRGTFFTARFDGPRRRIPAPDPGRTPILAPDSPAPVQGLTPAPAPDSPARVPAPAPAPDSPAPARGRPQRAEPRRG